MPGFNYESKVWGRNDVRVTPTDLNALRLRYCLEDLRGLSGEVLELGCGAGGMTRAILAHRPELMVSGCDISLSALSLARAGSKEMSYSQADAYDLPYPSGCFGAVLVFDVLEHIASPERAIREVWRVLEPGGLFHAFVPCEGEYYNLSGILGKLGWRAKEVYAGHIQQFTADGLKRMLAGAGFNVVGFRWSGHAVYQVFDMFYFGYLSVRRANPPLSVEGYLSAAPRGLLTAVFRLAKNAVAIGSYFESLCLRTIPGWGVHMTSWKVS